MQEVVAAADREILNVVFDAQRLRVVDEAVERAVAAGDDDRVRRVDRREKVAVAAREARHVIKAQRRVGHQSVELSGLCLAAAVARVRIEQDMKYHKEPHFV